MGVNPGFERDVDDEHQLPASKKSLDISEKVPSTESEETRAKRIKILKNIIIISFAFTLNFTSFNSMANLQTSINATLGATSLWVVYASLVLSCAFVPSWLIKKLKTKWTLPLCLLCYSTYIAAQFYPTYYTLVPTAFLLGLGAAPLWSAKCSYLTQAGEFYGTLVGENSEVIITRFFGIFFLFFQSSQVWGNLISSTVLSSGEGHVTVNRSEEFLQICGADFCPAFNDHIPSEEKNQERSKIITMSAIFLCCSIASAIVVAIFVDPLNKIGIEEQETCTKSGVELLIATFTHMLNINQILVIPLTIWSGLEQGFLQADFTRAFVTCGIGVHMVGYVMICYGVCDALCSISFSPLVKRFGRIPIFTFGAIINVSMLILMSTWKPHPTETALFFIIASLWGIGDAIWQTQINALYGVIFPGQAEAAFSNYRLWESLGFIMAFVWTSLICKATIMKVLIGFLAVAMSGYYVAEFLEKRGGWIRNGEKVETIKNLIKKNKN